MKTFLVLAMHGSPPHDFPKNELAEYFGLKSRLEMGGGMKNPALEERYNQLNEKICSWPRTAENDPFWAGSQKLAEDLQKAAGLQVILAFNDFCAPNLEEGMAKAISSGAEKLIVITTMMTKGGEHSEVEIPAAIQKVQSDHPQVKIIFAWPFEPSDVASFLAQQIQRFL